MRELMHQNGFQTILENPVDLFALMQIPRINQETGIPGPEPSETLKKFRSDAIVYPTQKQLGRVYFGQYLVCKDSLTAGVKGNVIKVGDVVYVLKMVSSADEAEA